MLLSIISIVAAAIIIGAVCLVALLGWGGKVSTGQRISLCGMAAGLLWAAPGRFLGVAPDLGDALFLVGLAGYVLATYGRAIGRRVDVTLDEAVADLAAARDREAG